MACNLGGVFQWVFTVGPQWYLMVSTQPNSCLSHLHLGRRKTPWLLLRAFLSAAGVWGFNWELSSPGAAGRPLGTGFRLWERTKRCRNTTAASNQRRGGMDGVRDGAGFLLGDTAAGTRPSAHPAVLSPLPVLIFTLDSLLMFPS